MAKKVVASLQKKEGRVFTKCIKMVKSEKNDSYAFEEGIIHNDNLKNFFAD
jgi:hypothetical protein